MKTWCSSKRHDADGDVFIHQPTSRWSNRAVGDNNVTDIVVAHRPGSRSFVISRSAVRVRSPVPDYLLYFQRLTGLLHVRPS